VDDGIQFALQAPPSDVEAQTRQLLEAGIPQRVMANSAQSEGAHFWASVRLLEPGVSMLYLIGHDPQSIVMRMCLPVATNTVATACDQGRSLTIDQLALLERLATGQEDFDFQYGLRLVWNDKDYPEGKMPVPYGTVLEVETVTFGYLHFRDLPRFVVPRTYVRYPLFLAI